MSVDKKLVPEIRFKGFSDDWSTCPIRDVCGVTFGGGTPSTNEKVFWNGEIPWIQSSDILNGSVSEAIAKKFITSIAVKKSATKLVPADSIAIVTRVGVGKISLMKSKYATSQDFLSLSDLNINSQFAVYVIWKQLELENEQVQGTSIKGITKEELLGKFISYPRTPKEQTAIGNYFQKLDTLINQHQQKYDKLSTIKKAMLEKMFPKQGEMVPEIRFKGFSKEWQERKLGEIGDTFTGLSGKEKNDFGHGQGRFVTYLNVFSNVISNENLIEQIDIDISQNEVQKGDVFFTTSSETPEDVGMSSVWMSEMKNVYLNSFCFGYRTKQKIDSYYLAYMLRSNLFRREISFLAQGISRYNISKTKVMGIKVSIPDIAEQEKIGNFFQKLDTLINQHQQQIVKLNNIKQACLSKMFV